MQKSRYVADVHHLRLMSLLNELVRDRGNKGAARVLGIDRRTVAASVRSGFLSDRTREALERALVEGDGTSESRERRDLEELCQRMEAFEEEMRGAVEAVRGDVETMGKEHARTTRLVESLFGHVGVAGDAGSGVLAPDGRGRSDAMIESSREYPELVTREPAQDDEEVYADAWPLVNEWRTLELRREVGTKLERARTRERIMELEIEMIDEQDLTLPPANSPMHPPEKRVHLGWRIKTLDDLRRERTKLEFLGRARRVLTFGLWKE
ncbi:MAG: hypothetical protein OXK79_10355 [Chloroflexota bacterium]|nr:hypothetical protein [Chloroflexota bacterium]